MRRRTVLGTTVAVVLLGWPAWMLVAWARYGHARAGARRDPLVDRVMPTFEVAESHAARVAAPAALTYAVAVATPLDASPVVRAIIHARERLLGVRGAPLPPGGVVAQLRAAGWGVIADVPGREVVLGTVTQPWEGDVRFRAVAPDAFAAFDDPGFVKIVVAISADDDGAGRSIARVQTRVATTDAASRARFRRYWAAFSPGILLIRRAMLREVRREAERRNRVTGFRTADRPLTGIRSAPDAGRVPQHVTEQ